MSPTRTWNVVLERTWIWLLSGVVLGVLPILLGWFIGKNDSVSNGELAISSAAIIGGAVSEVVFSQVPSRTYRTTLVLLGVLLVATNTTVYVAAGEIGPERTSLLSYVLFASTCVVAACCVAEAAGR